MTGRFKFLRLGVLAVVAVAAAVIIWSVVSGGDSKSVKLQLLQATAAQLPGLAAAQGHEVYWAGPRNGVRYEWTRTPTRRIFVRYLSGRAQIAERNRAFLTVATYSLPNAQNQLKALAAKNKGGRTHLLSDGALAYYDPTAVPNSAYVAFPGSNYEVEVFDPSPGKAYSLIKSGAIQQIR